MRAKTTRKKTGLELDRDIAACGDREALRQRIQRLIDKWEPRLGVRFSEWGFKQMKTYWGSTNSETRRVWFNPELCKLPPRYVEYLVVHELVHLLTDGHDAHFYELMDRHLPGWRALQARIEAPLTQYS